MCLEFGSCFGGRRRDDYGRSRGNPGNGYWSEPAPPIVAVHEAGQKAYDDGAPKAEQADAGSHGGYADLQDKAGSDTPQKPPAWHDGAPKDELADAGSHGGHACFQDKAGSETPQKPPAWHGAPKAEQADAGSHGGYADLQDKAGSDTPQKPPAWHDGAPKAEQADAGSHGGYADLQDKAGSDTPQKPPAWHNKVRDDAGYGAYTPRNHEAAADHREHAAMDYHQYQYPTTTTTLARYQVASR